MSRTFVMHTLVMALLAAVIVGSGQTQAWGTASTHIWAPSTDIQAFKVPHLTYDVYMPVEPDQAGNFPPTVTNIGLTIGIIPSSVVQAEVGFDHKTGLGMADRYPLYFNAKIGVPEGAAFNGSPAVAAGIFDVGTKDVTGYNVMYAKAAKSIDASGTSLGRFSLGYFLGDEELLTDALGEKDNSGVFLAWERTMSEISDNLWICGEYMGTESGYGSWSAGGAWKFTPDIGLVGDYTGYNRDGLIGTVTLQLDIDIR